LKPEARPACALSTPRKVRRITAARCAACDGKFGLVRHYSSRTALCSKKWVDRFKARRASDCNWLAWLRAALEQLPEDRAEAL